MSETNTSTDNICSSCAHANPAGARFCNQCGGGLDAHSNAPAAGYTPAFTRENLKRQPIDSTGERKQVTVVFVDIAGSSRLAEQAGAETWHGVLDSFFRILAAAVHKHGGSINQYTGDGIMALFGAPVALEEHARRAALASLEIRDQVRKFADQLRMQQGLNLSMRIGMNTGEIIMGVIGDELRADYTAQGHTVNVAARMESIAEPGHVYVAGESARQLQGYFELRDLGDIQVHGIDQSVAVHELIGPGQIMTRLQLSAQRGLSPFTGREQELGVLLRRAARLQSGAGGGLVLVEGPAGIGKSRLCHEFVQAAEEQAMHVSLVSCPPFEQALPYGPIQQLLRSYFEIEPEDGRARARRKVAGNLLADGEAAPGALQLIYDFLGLAESDDSAAAVAPEDRMARLIELCDEALSGKEEAAIVVVDDLQWADAQSAAFFRHLAEQAEGGPLLLLYNQRSDGGVEWARKLASETITLGALSGDACGELARSLLGDSEPLRVLAERLQERAAGNPFYVEEAIRELLDRGVLEGSPGHRHLTTDAVPELLPATVQALLAARLDQLSESLRRLVCVCAVLGHAVDRAMLADLCPHEPEDIEGLIEGGYLRSAADDLLEFAHPLIQEVAYDSQLASARKSWHGRAAEWLESRLAASPVWGSAAGRIAWHRAQAGEYAQAADWSMQSAAWFGQKDVRVALECFRNAAVWADSADENDIEARRTGIRARAGVIRLASLMPLAGDEVEQAWEKAKAASDISGLSSDFAELEFSRALVQLNHGRTDQAVALVESAMHRVAEGGMDDLLARFRLPVLNVYFVAGKIRAGLDALDQASAADWGHAPVTQENYLSRGLRALFIASQGDLLQAKTDLHAAIGMAEGLAQPTSWMYANLVDVIYLTREPDNATYYAAESLKWAEQFGSPLFLALAWRAEATACYLRKDYGAALVALERGGSYVAYGRQGHAFEPLLQAFRAACQLKIGRREQALEMAYAAVTAAKDMHADLWTLRASLVLADCLLANGAESDELHALAGDVAALVARSGAEFFAAPLALLNAEILLSRGELAAASTALEGAAELFASAGAPARAASARARIENLGD